MRFPVPILRALCFLLPTLFWIASALAAPVPRETIERLADIKVEQAEIEHLNNITKLTDAEYRTRRNSLAAEQEHLWTPYSLATQITPAELEAATTAITGLTRTKLSLLEPRWEKEKEDFRSAGERRHAQNRAALDQDVRRAADIQRQRLLLQRQLDRGTIDRAAFSAKDADAVAAIAGLRQKYETIGGSFPRWFDEYLTRLTTAVADSPDTILPKPQVPQTGEGKADFNADVKLAASIYIKMEENGWRLHKKQISSNVWRETELVYNHDLSRLRARYDALKRGDEFQNAYLRMAQAAKTRQAGPATAPATYTPTRNPAPKEDVITWLGIGGVILVIGVLFMMKKKKPQDNGGDDISDIYGSASWAPHRAAPEAPLSLRGVMFGKSGSPAFPPQIPGMPIISKPEAHTLIVARTRAGKGTTVIVPTLLRYGHSMLVIDPKGENAAITARTRRDQLRHTVHIVNPWGEMEQLYADLGFKTATFNPLDAIDRRDPNAVAIAQTLAATMCPIHQGTKESFWQGSAADVLAGVLLWLADQPGETKTLARAREMFTQSRADFQKHLIRMKASTAFGGAIREMVSQYIDLAPETYSGILANLVESTKFLSDPQIKASTATSSFSMEKLRDERMTVYIVIPHDRIQTHSTWLRIIIAAAMQSLKTRAAQAKPPQHRCMFLIDEFGSIGHIADIPRDIALMSGYGLDFTLVIQGLDQLKHHYKEAAATILTNCAYKWFCYINELETAKYLSETLGKKTVRTTGKSTSTGQSAGGATAGETTTYGETGRLLLTPDEILNLGRDTAILIHPLEAPNYLRPVEYWNLTKAFAHLKNTQPQSYWMPPLDYDRNPYWQEQKQEKQRPAQPAAKMTDKEARSILGVSDTATAAEIKAAFLKLMKKFHPDLDGSNYLAQKIIAAKELLLGK